MRWASGSSTPVKVGLGPTNVAGITASMIACENGIENSIGGVIGSWSSTSRSPTWLHKSLRNSSLALCNSSFLTNDTARSIWMCSWSALDATIVSWRACIVFMICCRVRLSPQLGATDPCLVFLIFLYLSCSCEWDSDLNCAPRWAPNVPTGWLDCPRTSTTITRPVMHAFVCAFSPIQHLKSQGQRAP